MPKDTILMMKAKVVMKKAADLDVLNKVKNAEEKAVLKALNLKKKNRRESGIKGIEGTGKKRRSFEKKNRKRDFKESRST